MAKKEGTGDYGGSSIKVLEGLEGVRHQFDLVELSQKIKKRGDILVLSKELKINYSSLKHAIEEGRILSKFPGLHKSKVNPLSRLRTNRDLEKFGQEFDINRLSVRELYRKVKEWNLMLQRNPLMILSEEEHSLILGGLLGDASIRKRDRNSCFRFSHSISQKDYAVWKASVLEKFNISEFREVKRKMRDGFIHAIDFATKTHPVFNYYRELFYGTGRKRVNQMILNQLNPRSLSIWICDDGSYETKQGYIILCTYSFSLAEHKLMQKFFNNKFGLNPTIGFRDEKYYYLRFKKKDSRKLIKMISPFVPECMLYKIGGIRND